MSTTVLNIKIDPKVKTKAMKIAGDLGLSLSGVLNAYLREFIRTKTIHFSLEEKPSPYLIAALKETENQIKNGEVYSFDNQQEALDFLK